MNRTHALVFYDGNCGLCHHAVRFALARDAQGSLFRFAPLQGSTLQGSISTEVAERLPDSIVIQTRDGTLLVESEAVLFMLREIGGGWGGFGRVAAVIPRPWRDLVYRAVARTRHLIFRRPADLCPVVPASIRNRFLP